MHELEIQTGRFQVSVGKAGRVQVSLAQGCEKLLEMERTLDLRVIPLLEGLVHAETEEDHALLSMIKGISMNLARLPL